MVLSVWTVWVGHEDLVSLSSSMATMNVLGFLVSVVLMR